MARMDDVGTVVVDCQVGRRMGCKTLCCQLFVPLSINELVRGLRPQSPLSTLLRQEADGYCTYLDRTDHRCTIWHDRPLVCRRYDCNHDPKLQVVLREGMTSFKRLIEQAKLIPREQWQLIPLAAQPVDDAVTLDDAAPPKKIKSPPRKRAKPVATPRKRTKPSAGSRKRKSKKT